MNEKIKKAVAIVLSGFVALKISDSLSPEIIKGLNDTAQYASFLNPNLILNLIRYSIGDFTVDIIKAGILVLSAFGIYKITSD